MPKAAKLLANRERKIIILFSGTASDIVPYKPIAAPIPQQAKASAKREVEDGELQKKTIQPTGPSAMDKYSHRYIFFTFLTQRGRCLLSCPARSPACPEPWTSQPATGR